MLNRTSSFQSSYYHRSKLKHILLRDTFCFQNTRCEWHGNCMIRFRDLRCALMRRVQCLLARHCGGFGVPTIMESIDELPSSTSKRDLHYPFFHGHTQLSKSTCSVLQKSPSPANEDWKTLGKFLESGLESIVFYPDSMSSSHLLTMSFLTYLSFQ